MAMSVSVPKGHLRKKKTQVDGLGLLDVVPARRQRALPRQLLPSLTKPTWLANAWSCAWMCRCGGRQMTNRLFVSMSSLATDGLEGNLAVSPSTSSFFFATWDFW